MRIPILKTAFAGLGLLRRRPGLALGLLLLQLVVYLIMAQTPLLLGDDATAATFGLHGLLLLAANSLAGCAVLRATLRPEDRGLLYFRAGPDELRLLGLILLLAPCLALLGMVGWFLVFLLGGGTESSTPLALAGLGACGLIIVGALGWTGLAGPKTFAEKRLRLLSAWRLSAGAYWRLAGVFAIIMVTSAILYLAMLTAFGVLGGISGFGVSFRDVWGANYRTTAGIFTQARMILWALSAVTGTLTTLMWTGAGASAYARLTEQTPQRQADVFA